MPSLVICPRTMHELTSLCVIITMPGDIVRERRIHYQRFHCQCTAGRNERRRFQKRKMIGKMSLLMTAYWLVRKLKHFEIDEILFES